MTMRKWMVLLLTVCLLLGMVPLASAEGNNQVIDAGGSILYNAAGQQVNGTNLGDNGSVVKITKIIEQYMESGNAVENEFVVTLQVQTSQNIRTISSDTPDSAVLLVMDVSNSMDNCIHCGQEANHEDHTGTTTTTYYCSGTTGNTFVRGRNDRCRHCGKYQSQHNPVSITTEGECAYQSRLDSTKIAAKDFLYEFANETGAEGNDRRMVAIVAYGTHAVTERDWIDITTTAGMYSAEEAIENLTIANGSHDITLQGGGTSIESGLALGRNLLGQNAVANIDYRYTILLTDGQPTYPANDPSSTSTTSISGSTGNSGSSTQESDVDNVPAIAQSIRSRSKLYSICFGKVDGQDVWDLTPFGNWSGSNPSWSTNNNTTVGSWLTSFSTTAYKAADASTANLFDSFNSILAQIQVAAKAWKVEDWMGPYMVYGEPVTVSNGSGGYVSNTVDATPDASDYTGAVPAFVWDLLTSENDPAITNWDSANNTGVLGYTYKYRVTLDNLDTRYSTTNGNENSPSNAATNANTRATLRYATTDTDGNWPESLNDYRTVNFAQPTVQGLIGTLTFEKVDQNGNPLEGWTFRLRSNQYTEHPEVADQWTYLDATSDANGVVTFAGIPSGHSYTLLEAEKPNNADHYLDAGDFTVDVSWGDASVYNSSGRLTDGNDDDSYIELVNKHNTDALGKLTLQKSFAEGSTVPASIRFHIDGPNGFSANRELNSADAQQDGTWLWTMTGLEFGEYTVRETNAIDVHGNRLRDTHDLTYSILVDGQSQVTDQNFVEGQSEPQITVQLSANDTDKTVAVQFVNKMTPKQGQLSISKTFEDLPSTLIGADMGLTMSVIATPVDDSGAAISGEQPVTLNLAWNGTAFVASAQLPIGRYRLTEEISGAVKDYSLLHYMFLQNGAEIEDGIVTIKEDNDSDANNGKTALTVTLENHYEQDTGHIYINKSFGGDLDASYFSGRVIHVNIRENDKYGDVVATLVLDEGDGQWTVESPELPVGTYYLEEVVQDGKKGTAYEQGYVHTVTWAPGETVNLTKNALVSIGLTNSYESNTGTITLNKAFAGDLTAADFGNKTITVQIMNGTKVMDELTISGTQLTDTSIALPVGTYTLVETGAEVTGYTLSQTWAGVSAGTTDVAVTRGSNASVTLTNSYESNTGTVTLTKAFDGDLTAADFGNKTITVQIMNGTKVMDELTISGTQLTDTSIALPVGTYTLVETGAEVTGYTLSQTWVGVSEGTTNVAVTGGSNANVTLTNSYSQKLGALTVTKYFEGLPDDLRKSTQISILVRDANAKPSAPPAATLTLHEGKWSDTVILPVGFYTLEETGASKGEYVLSANWAGLTDGKIEITENHTQQAAAQVSVTNTYTAQFGYLTIEKKLNGLASADSQFVFNVRDASDNVAATVTVHVANGQGSATVKLPLGQYTVEEVQLPQHENSRYEASWSPATPMVSVSEQQTVTVVCTNTLVPKATVRIPIQKTVRATGNTMPEKTTFSFSSDWAVPSNADLDIRFENASGNTAGRVVQTAANTYTITVDGENTVKGYIVISGYASDLDGFQLTTWEKLSPYSSVQDAANANWSYDQTAQSNMLRWNVTLNANGYNLDYAIALGADDGKEMIAFENIYDKVEVPELPQTGDHDMPLLYLLIIVLSVGGILMIRRRVAK